MKQIFSYFILIGVFSIKNTLAQTLTRYVGPRTSAQLQAYAAELQTNSTSLVANNGLVVQNVSSTCLSCLCQALTGCNSFVCENGICGPFGISRLYWEDSGVFYQNNTIDTPNAFENCANDRSCAEKAVAAYLKKYAQDCNNDGKIDCNDYVAIHLAGPNKCGLPSQIKQYSPIFQSIQKCYKKYGPLVPLVSDQCLGCICDASSGCNQALVCNDNYAQCDLFNISQPFWIDSNLPDTEIITPVINNVYQNCILNPRCSVNTVQRYISIYEQDCNGDGRIDCYDYAAIHFNGGFNCSRTYPEQLKLSSCVARL